MKRLSENLKIAHFDSAKETAEAAGENLSKTLAAFYGQPVLLMLSGGSALKILDFADENILSERLTVAVLDERFSGDPLVNNFSQLQDTDFYMRALQKDANFIGTLPRTEDTRNTLAARLETSLKKWRAENPTGKIIATIGMGSDGHTAGIMPFPEGPKTFKQLFDNKKWTAAYDAGNKNPFRERITATLPFLRILDKAVGFIVGEEKKPAFDRIILKQAKLAEIPAMIFWEMKDLQIFTDIASIESTN